MKFKELALSAIIPYKNNPYIHTADDFARVKHSIQNNGYLVPIVVDKSCTILAGHLRHKALTELYGSDYKETVIFADHLTPEQADKFRIADNSLSNPHIDPDSMMQELSKLYNADDLEKINLETGLDPDEYIDITSIDQQSSGFFSGADDPDEEEEQSATRNETEIVRKKQDAEIRITIPIEDYEVFTAIRPELYRSHGVKSPGELFMKYVKSDIKRFGLK